MSLTKSVCNINCNSPYDSQGKVHKTQTSSTVWSPAAILSNDWNYMNRKLSFTIRDGPIGADSGNWKNIFQKYDCVQKLIYIPCKTKSFLQILVQLSLIFHRKKRLYGSSCTWHWLMLKDIEVFTSSGLKNIITVFCSIFTSLFTLWEKYSILVYFYWRGESRMKIYVDSRAQLFITH